MADDVVANDAGLIDETLAGQPEAFGQLVTKYQDRLYSAMVHVIGSADDAQDVVQEAFVQAFVKLDTFKRTSAFYTWLYRIAFNRAISLRRRKRPSVSIEQTREVSGEEPVGTEPGPEEQMTTQDRVALVQAALQELSEEHRSVIVLREMEGFHYDEISEILDLPVGTVRSRLHRARMQMRGQLKQVLHEDIR